jgi:hypothetical protein
MAINDHRSRRSARKRAVRWPDGAAGVAGAFTPDALLALYNANLDAALELLETALHSASRFQHLQAKRGEQALLLAEKTVSALSRADGHDFFTAQAELTQEALNEAQVYWQQMLAVSDDSRRELLVVLDRQWRINGIPAGLPLADIDAAAKH